VKANPGVHPTGVSGGGVLGTTEKATVGRSPADIVPYKKKFYSYHFY
jgi:hypothetical protein